MGVPVPVIWVLIRFLAIALGVQGTTGFSPSASPYFYAAPPIRHGNPNYLHHERQSPGSPSSQPSGFGNSASPSTSPESSPTKSEPEPIGDNALGPASQASGSMHASPYTYAHPPMKGGGPYEKPFGVNALRPVAQPSVSVLQPPLARKSVRRQRMKGNSSVSATHSLAPSPSISSGAPRGKMRDTEAPMVMPADPVFIMPPSNKYPETPLPPLPTITSVPPQPDQATTPESEAPRLVPVRSPPTKTERSAAVVHPVKPGRAPLDSPAPIAVSIPPSIPEGNGTGFGIPITTPVVSPSKKHDPSPPSALPIPARVQPPISHPRDKVEKEAPVLIPIGPTVTVAPSPRKSVRFPENVHPGKPRGTPLNAPDIFIPVPSNPPIAPQGKAVGVHAPMLDPHRPAASTSNEHPQSSHQRIGPENRAPIPMPIGPTVSTASPRSTVEKNPPPFAHQVKPKVVPENLHVPVASPSNKLPPKPLAYYPTMPAKPPKSFTVPPPRINRKSIGLRAASPPGDAQNQSSPAKHTTSKHPLKHTVRMHPDSTSPLQSIKSPPKDEFRSPSSLFYRNHPVRNYRANTYAPAPSILNAPASEQDGTRSAFSPLNSVFPPPPLPLPGSEAYDSPAQLAHSPSPSQTAHSGISRIRRRWCTPLRNPAVNVEFRTSSIFRCRHRRRTSRGIRLGSQCSLCCHSIGHNWTQHS